MKEGSTSMQAVLMLKYFYDNRDDILLHTWFGLYLGPYYKKWSDPPFRRTREGLKLAFHMHALWHV